MSVSDKDMTPTPTRRLSSWRVLLALLVVGGLMYGTRLGLDHWRHTEAVTAVQPWFAPYVDVTATPTYSFEQLGSPANSAVLLSFIVSAPSDPCTPTWGTHHTLDEAATALDLDRRIARLQQQGGRIAVSFGGALNSELALGCTDEGALQNAYRAVIDRYHIDTIDLDLEGTGLNDLGALERRATALAVIQAEYRSHDKSLAIWVTLPVTPQGLAQNGTDAVAQLLDKNVDLAGINVMTMDYGASRADGQSMLEATQSALTETHRQLGVLYKDVGISLNSNSLWRKLGATPMIGQNDVADELFMLSDAVGLNHFALTQGMSRLSMWSANRDIPCGDNYIDVKVVSDSCSGVKTPKYGFAQALSSGFDGDLTQSAKLITTADPESNAFTADDPENSPYQVWEETGAYPKGIKVVWHGNVYEAKWWTKNDLPDNPVLQSWETPWQLVGPVLAGEKPVQQPTLPKGTYPVWSGTTVYNGGDRVLFDGVPFQAKWWNQGDSPAASAANSDSSPWLALTQSQIIDILKQLNKTTTGR